MRLEILIVVILFVLFLGLSQIANQKQAELMSMQNSTNDTINTDNSSISNSDFILEQIQKSNSTKQEIVNNLSNKDDLVLQDELKKKNDLFIKLVNGTN